MSIITRTGYGDLLRYIFGIVAPVHLDLENTVVPVFNLAPTDIVFDQQNTMTMAVPCPVSQVTNPTAYFSNMQAFSGLKAGVYTDLFTGILPGQIVRLRVQMRGYAGGTAGNHHKILLTDPTHVVGVYGFGSQLTTNAVATQITQGVEWDSGFLKVSVPLTICVFSNCDAAMTLSWNAVLQVLPSA